MVGSCGTYRLSGQPAVLPTHRPRGRVDYQLLYVAAGNIVRYCPIEEQRYLYYGADHPEVFWVHFTGYDAKISCVTITSPQSSTSTTRGPGRSFGGFFSG